METANAAIVLAKLLDNSAKARGRFVIRREFVYALGE
jgi:hypothetical protein